ALDGQKPRSGEGGEDDRGGREDQRAQKNRDPPRGEGPEKENRSGQADRDETLREKAGGGGRAGCGGDRRPWPPGFAAKDRRAPRQKRGREAERQQAVGQVRAGEEESHRRGEKKYSGRQSSSAATPRRENNQENRSHARQARREPCGPGGLAEEAEGRGVEPVEKRRLFEVRDAVQARDDEIAGGEHLARDFGRAGLARLGQSGARGLHPDHGREKQERGGEGPRRAAPRLR